MLHFYPLKKLRVKHVIFFQFLKATLFQKRTQKVAKGKIKATFSPEKKSSLAHRNVILVRAIYSCDMYAIESNKFGFKKVLKPKLSLFYIESSHKIFLNINEI